ncbi:MAG: hypothetical protein A3F72_05160 [Bacteroidetes bacterium RIFCSPLOWO2_12_FULL_35_15]|nr:MAG: hypothetical protein A3F72_05160 [Bacteroidetes bacterium RIFCSPLOWO2_12_FULL_35_15]
MVSFRTKGSVERNLLPLNDNFCFDEMRFLPEFILSKVEGVEITSSNKVVVFFVNIKKSKPIIFVLLDVNLKEKCQVLKLRK